jgi:hypothetical protein
MARMLEPTKIAVAMTYGIRLTSRAYLATPPRLMSDLHARMKGAVRPGSDEVPIARGERR